jgi:hypothetical protein
MLYLRGKLSEALIVPQREKDRVVAEASIPPHFSGEDPLDGAVKGSERDAVFGDGQDTTEAGGSLLRGHTLDFFEDKGRILLVGAAGSGIAGGIDTRLTTQGIDLEA